MPVIMPAKNLWQIRIIVISWLRIKDHRKLFEYVTYRVAEIKKKLNAFELKICANKK